MKISILGFENEIILKNGKINILEVEDKKLFRKIVTLINNQSNGIDKSNDIILKDENNDRLSFAENVFCVNDLFNIDFNDKKILNKIFSIVDINVKNREDYEFEKINLELRNYLINEINEIPFEFTMKDELNVIDILKNYSLKFDEMCYNELIDRIEYLIDLVSFLKISKILVLINMKTFFEKDELIEIYKYANYHEINLLLVENYIQPEIIDGEIKNIIDKEFDDIIKT